MLKHYVINMCHILNVIQCSFFTEIMILVMPLMVIPATIDVIIRLTCRSINELFLEKGLKSYQSSSTSAGNTDSIGDLVILRNVAIPIYHMNTLSSSTVYHPKVV